MDWRIYRKNACNVKRKVIGDVTEFLEKRMEMLEWEVYLKYKICYMGFTDN